MTCSCCGDFAIARVGQIELCEGCLNEFEDTFGAGRNSVSQWQSTAGPKPSREVVSPTVPSPPSLMRNSPVGSRPGEVGCASRELLEERND